MAHKRGVFYRKKHNLKQLFPSNKEKYLCLTFQLENTVLLRLLLCNESLCERADVWAYASESVKNTFIQPTFSIIDKQEYMLNAALDRFNRGGHSAYININSASQLIMAIDLLMENYYKEFNQEDVVPTPETNFIQFNELGLPMILDKTQLVEYIPQDESEIMNSYQ